METQEQTPKQKYDSIMKNVADDNAKVNPASQEEADAEAELEKELADMDDEDTDEVEDEPITEGEEVHVDKTMGTEKHAVTTTIEQHQKQKVADAQKEAIKGLIDMKKSQSQHLKPEQIKTLTLILAKLEQGKLDHPVLKHLVGEKIKIAQTYVQSQVLAKQLQQEMLNKITELTNNIVKCKGAIEHVDKQILDLVKENPSLLD